MIDVRNDIDQEPPRSFQMLLSSEAPPTPTPSGTNPAAGEYQLSIIQENTLGAAVSTVDLKQIWE